MSTDSYEASETLEVECLWDISREIHGMLGMLTQGVCHCDGSKKLVDLHVLATGL